MQRVTHRSKTSACPSTTPTWKRRWECCVGKGASKTLCLTAQDLPFFVRCAFGQESVVCRPRSASRRPRFKAPCSGQKFSFHPDGPGSGKHVVVSDIVVTGCHLLRLKFSCWCPTQQDSDLDCGAGLQGVLPNYSTPSPFLTRIHDSGQ